MGRLVGVYCLDLFSKVTQPCPCISRKTSVCVQFLIVYRIVLSTAETIAFGIDGSTFSNVQVARSMQLLSCTNADVLNHHEQCPDVFDQPCIAATVACDFLFIVPHVTQLHAHLSMHHETCFNALNILILTSPCKLT